MTELAELAAQNGANIIQYRDKNASDEEMKQNCLEIHKVLKPLNVPLIVNDRVEIAKETNVEGVHVGQSDMDAREVREILGEDKIVGLSISQSEHVDSAPLDILDYVFIGGVFATESKNNAKSIGVKGWRELADKIKKKNNEMPIGAIAGIDASNANELIRAGADGVAVISAIFMQDDVGAATAKLKEAMQI